MRVMRRQDELILRDRPACFWLLGLFFMAIGGAASYTALGSFVGQRGVPHWQSIVALAAAAIIAGLHFIASSPGTVVRLRRGARTITIHTRGLFQRKEECIGFGEMEDIYLVEKGDIDGGPVYSIRVRLTDGRELPFTSLWLHGLPELETCIAEAKAYVAETRDSASYPRGAEPRS